MHKRANQPRDGTSVFIAHRTRALILDHFSILDLSPG